ncbi:TIGR03757 family integrating conjugative element protein [Alcaligenaceae bacterium]|nr:TIGR03757 family integrating conjugative element protein [Alcaligenaceae bacterium]
MLHSLSCAPAMRRPLAIALTAALFACTATAADVWVITDLQHPAQGTPDRLIELDAPARIEADLSADLPSDSRQAAELVRHRLKQGGPLLQQRLAGAYQGVADAWSLGITTIPAIVVDQRYVIYGESNLDQALTRIEQYRKEQP